MDTHAPRLGIGFSPEERAYIRRELDMVFSTLPTVADGFQLKTRATGSNKGSPKLSPAAQTLVARSLMIVETSVHPPRLHFTEVGYQALREMMADPRLANPSKFAHIRRELGVDPELDSGAAE